MAMEEKDRSDALVEQIDQLMAGGSGHLTITEEDTAGDGLQVKTYRSMDCSKGNMACCVPTELMDEE